jgi:hypothetical protein
MDFKTFTLSLINIYRFFSQIRFSIVLPFHINVPSTACQTFLGMSKVVASDSEIGISKSNFLLDGL